MVRNSAWIWACVMSLSVTAGCQAILQFDEKKLDSTGTAGNGGDGATTTTQGGGGATTTQGGGGAGADGGGGSGGGVQCQNADNCPQGNEPCKQAACINNVCQKENKPDNTDLPDSMSGDCHKNVCDGGEPSSIIDTKDPFNDNNDCTQDMCAGGTPNNQPSTKGTACTMGGIVCNGSGKCVECNQNGDCTNAESPICSNNQCIPATCDDNAKNGSETDIDCGGMCNGCDTNQSCVDDKDCYHNVCSGVTCKLPNCTDGVQNGGGYLMNNGETDIDCGGPCGPTCGPMKGCNVNGDCSGNQCSGLGGTCIPNCGDGVKNNNETDADCGGNTCGPCGIGKGCIGDNDCASTAFCSSSNVCQAKFPLGQACVGANQCMNNFCVDGVCCNNSCGDTCASCNLTGSIGACSTIPAGTDPDNECNGSGGTDVCSGFAGVPCTKVVGSTCINDGQCLSGFCVDGVCCSMACNGTCVACVAAKTGSVDGACASIPSGQDPDSECTGAATCNGLGACGTTGTIGAPCSAGSQCASGFCADGVCCNSACNGVCQQCNSATNLGACTGVPGGTDPFNECPGAQVCSATSTCVPGPNGALCTASTQCSSGFCVDGVCCNSGCVGVCLACNQGGASNGVCTPYPQGTDPQNECQNPTPNCSGAAACGT